MKKDLAPIEFRIVKLLWKHTQLSSREIHDEIMNETGWTYSTTRTVLDRMAKKGLVAKKSFHGLNVYESSLSKVNAYAQQLSRFASTVFETDSLELLPLFAKAAILSDEELASLRSLLEKKDTER